MYLSITTKEKEGLHPSSVLVLTDHYGKTSPSNSIPKPDIIIQKSKVSSVPEFLETFQKTVREADEKQAHSLKIFITDDAISLRSEAIVDSIVSLVNKDIDFTDHWLAILLEPDKHFLGEIILVIEDRQLRDAVRKRLSRKADWSKARKLAFVIDCLELDLDRKSICKRHFIHQSSFPKYLQDFSGECKPELLERLQNIQTYEYGKEVASIFKDCDQIQVLVSALKSAHRNGFFLDSYSTDFQLSRVIKKLESLTTALDYYERLFPYIADLVPDSKFNHTHPLRKASPKARRHKGIKKTVRFAPSELKEEIRDDYAYLLKRIQKIQLLKDSVFPVSKLQDSWPINHWDQIFSEKAPAHKITLELLSDHYNLGKDRLRQILPKSPECY
jgi:hypothetical protein